MITRAVGAKSTMSGGTVGVISATSIKVGTVVSGSSAGTNAAESLQVLEMGGATPHNRQS